MAMGVPTVASVVAARGVDAEPGRHLHTADSPAEYASAIVSLLRDRTARHELGDAGRARMLSHHQWSRSMTVLDQLLTDEVHHR